MSDRAEELKSLQEEIKRVLAGEKNAVNAINEETTKMSFILPITKYTVLIFHTSSVVAEKINIELA